MSAERAEVMFGRSLLAYSLRRTGRQKTVAIAVDPREGVLVRAPGGVDRARVDRMVLKKAPWITARLREFADLMPPPSAREFVAGEGYRYLGRQYRLRVGRGRANSVKLVGGHLVVTLADRPGRSSRTSSARKALVKWFRARAEERLHKVVAKWAERLAVTPMKVWIRDQRLRWGSCDGAGMVRFNWRVIQAAPRLIEYVVAHELVHLLHPNHTIAFWATLGRAMPDYEARREALREVGVLLNW